MLRLTNPHRCFNTHNQAHVRLRKKSNVMLIMAPACLAFAFQEDTRNARLGQHARHWRASTV